MTDAVAVYGKIPAAADFVRVNTGLFQRAGLDRWFQEGIEHLHRERTRLPAEPARFLLFSAQAAQPLVGAFAPGQDGLGRAFPVVVCADLPGGSPGDDLSLAPLRFASLLDAAAGLAVAAQSLTAAELAARAAALSSGRPTASSCPSLSTLLGGASVSEIRTTGDPAYALTTLVAACAQARRAKAGSPGRALTLDGQADSAAARAFWLELARRHLGAEQPSALWAQKNGRLLIALGPAPSLVLAYWADPTHSSPRRWPLCTANAAARARALARLSPVQARLLARADASLADVLSAFSEAACRHEGK